MIDKKKIKEAAKAYEKKCDEAINDMLNGKPYDGDPYDFCGFLAGANWALQEFKKSLWHDASEEPEHGKEILYEYESSFHTIQYLDKNWNACLWLWGIERWCYIDDILPKEGGEQ